MFESISQFLQICFTGPVWPASVLICLLLAYCVLIFMGLADGDFEVADADGDGIAGFADSAGSLGAASIRWLNLDTIPVFIWMSVFGFCWWLLSLLLWEGFDSDRYQPLLLTSVILASRNLVLSVTITKFLTLPMRGWFERSTAFRTDQIVGQICEIETGEATTEFGRARFKTDGAPLLLNIRTTGETLVKGQLAEIIDFDPTARVYTVQSHEAGK
ncbi:hypothetical protein SH139x_005517 [Planctomycetaceae bacterium SH139]